jgi:hypothetical protein
LATVVFFRESYRSSFSAVGSTTAT